VNFKNNVGNIAATVEGVDFVHSHPLAVIPDKTHFQLVLPILQQVIAGLGGIYRLMRRQSVPDKTGLGDINFGRMVIQQRKILALVIAITVLQQNYATQITTQGINFCLNHVRLHQNALSLLQYGRIFLFLRCGRLCGPRLGNAGVPRCYITGYLLLRLERMISLPCLPKHENRERKNDKQD